MRDFTLALVLPEILFIPVPSLWEVPSGFTRRCLVLPAFYRELMQLRRVYITPLRRA